MILSSRSTIVLIRKTHLEIATKIKIPKNIKKREAKATAPLAIGTLLSKINLVSIISRIYKNGKKSRKNISKNGKKYLDKPNFFYYPSTMLPKNISLKTFQIIDNIAKSHQVTDAQWVEASGLKYVSRLSEIRSLSRGKYGGKGIDRIFSISKCVSLVDGLIKLVGGEVVRKELERALDKSKSNREIALLLTLSFPEESLEQLILYQKAHLNSIKPKKNKKEKP